MTQPTSPETPKPAKKPRRWRRRTIIGLIVLIGVILIFRAVISLLLPTVLNKIAHGYKLQSTYARLDLSITGGNAAIWGLQFQPEEGGDPVFRADYCQGDISVIDLIKGRLVVYRAAADGVDIDIERTADGRIPLLDRFTSSPSSAQPASANPPKPLDLQPPVRIDAFRLAHIRAQFHDASVKPEFYARSTLDVRLSNLGNPNQPARFDVEFTSDPMLDSLRIDGSAERDEKGIAANLHLLMRGLHLKPAQAYLQTIGLRPTADDISASMTGKLTASVAPNPQDGIQADLSLNDGRISIDGKEAAAVDRLAMDIQSLNPGNARLGTLSINGVRFNAGRQTDGSLHAIGVELLKTTSSAPATTNAASTTHASPFQWSLEQFTLSGFHAGFVDEAVSPPATLAFDSPQVQLTDLVCDPDHPGHAAKLSATLNASGIIREIRVLGTVAPFSDDRSFKLTIIGKGISPQAMSPYLNAAGLSSEWKDGSFSVSTDGSLTFDNSGKLTANANLSDFNLADGVDLLALNQAQIKGASIDPQTRTVRVDSIDISGPSLQLKRDTDGQLHALGFKTKPLPAPSPSVQTASDPSSAISPIDNFEIDHFAWKDVRVSMTDAAVAPPATLAISDAGITVDDLSVHLQPGTFTPKEGKIRAWLVAPRIASRISLDGIVKPTPDRTTCVFDVHGDGIKLDALASYFKTVGIEPTVKNGTFQMHGNASLNQTSTHPGVSLACTDLKYSDGSQSLISVAGIQIDGLRASPDKISLDAFEVKSPHARIERSPDGTLEAAGLRFIAHSPAQEPVMPATQPAAASNSTFAAAIKSLKITDAGFDWIDHSIEPNIETSLHLQAGLSDFIFAPNSKPAPFYAAASIPGCLDNAKVDGTISASATDQAIKLNINANSLRAGVMKAYLPPNSRAIIKNGSFHSAIFLTASQNPAGGRSVDLNIRNLNYRDADAADSFLKFDSFHLGASRLDTNANRIALDDVSLTGLETNVQKTSTGTDLLGVEFGDSQASLSVPTAPASPSTSPSSRAAPPKDVLRQFAAERTKLPYVTLKTLNLNVRKISIADATQAGASPLVISDVHIRNNNPIAWMGTDPESNPSTDIEATGRIDPVADQFDLVARTTPFSRQKTLGLDLTVSGIHGQGLLDLNPQLASTIDPHELQQGRFNASVNAMLKLQTARPTSFDLSRGGKLDLSIKDIAFRDNPAGPVLAGIGEIHSEGIALGPNLQGIDIRELEIDNLTGRAQRKSDGLHLLGLIVRNSPTTQPAAASADIPQPVKTDPPPANEIKIDRLLISGMDFRLEDLTCDPPLVVPINGLDVEAQGLSNLALYKDMPIHFDVLANAAKVNLPQRQPGEPPSRDLFAQVTGSGIVTLYPKLKGWSKASISGFELLSARGVAEQEKIKLGGGIFDADFDARFPGDGSIDTSTRLVLTDLSLSEPPNGFISQKLKLPAPLDVVILAVQDQDGSITIPLNVNIHQGKIDPGSIVTAGATALAQMITTAVASAPLKVTNLLGLGGKQAGQEQPAVLSFPAGYSALQPAQIAELTALAKRLKDKDSLQVTLRSDAGKNDVALAAQRVNPSPDDALTLAGALSRRREALLEARQDAASQVRALLASTDTEAAAGAIERLRTINRELFDTENAMDHAYDLLRPGADRQAMRRTRAATLAIARSRLEAVRDILIGTGRDAIGKDRVRIGNPQFVDIPENPNGSVTITTIKIK